MAQEFERRDRETGGDAARFGGSRTGESRLGESMTSLRSEMDRLLERFRNRGLFSATGAVSPRVDVRETHDAVLVEAELPGLDGADVSVTIKDGMLTLKGEKRHAHEEEQNGMIVRERRYGSFRRSLQLPRSVDEDRCEATFDKGVLHIRLPKRPEAMRPERKIEIGGGGDQGPH